jgi:peptidoglycan/xylan/chitin deacetylase (PgdA/CDA1 family)
MQDEDQRVPETADWRHMVAAGLYQTGLVRAFQAVSRHYEYASDNGGGQHLRRAQKAKCVIIGYHSVGTHGFPHYCRLPRRVFAEQMRYIKRRYRVLSLRQMMEELEDPKADGQSVVVTFDDGYLGTYTDAFPVLKDYAIPATVYLTAGAIESGEVAWYDQIFSRFQRAPSEVSITLDVRRTFRLTDFASRVTAAAAVVSYLRTVPDMERQRWCESFGKVIPVPNTELRGSMMSWDQVREMCHSGTSFGCHTMTHPVLSRLTPAALQQEIAESKWLIENRLGVQVDDLAFPFGDCASLGAKVLSSFGLRTAATAILGVNGPGGDASG